MPIAKSEGQKINRAFMSLRIPVTQWLSESRFKELLDLLLQYRPVVDEIAFFSSSIHPVLPLETIRERMEIVTQRIAMAKQAGYCAGINFLSTLGHCDEYLDDALKGEYTRITGIDGKIAQGSFCPNDDNFRHHLRLSYTYTAMTKPDFIWLDDDIRLDNHSPVAFGCFCDRCLQLFAGECGDEYTREELYSALNDNNVEIKKKNRLAWLQHNANTLNSLLQLIEESVHVVAPEIELGLMTGEHFYERYDFSGNVATLSGPCGTPVRWRPGGGFYTDDIVGDLFWRKSVIVGRQIAALPTSVINIQAENENFPYQPLKKSSQVNILEPIVHIAAGCTGTAYNILGMCNEPPSDYSRLMQQLALYRPFYDLLVKTLGRSQPCGICAAWNADFLSAENVDGHKEQATHWPDGIYQKMGLPLYGIMKELYQCGLPAAYGPAAAEIMLLTASGIPAMSRSELEKILSGGVYLDGTALTKLNELGFHNLTGFEVAEWVDHDCAEVLTDEPFNGSDAGTRRDCVQAFWPNPCALIKPVSAETRILACKTGRLTNHPESPVLGIFENHLGGRIAVAGYSPWTYLQSKAKDHQLKKLFRWLSHDRLSGYIGSFHKTALWVRKTVEGRAAAVVINASFDPAEQLEIVVKTLDHHADLFYMDGRKKAIEAITVENGYCHFVLPSLMPWQAILICGKGNR